MNEANKNIIDQIVEDRRLLYKKMIFEADASAMCTLSAFLYASVGKRADVDKYVECKKYFNKTVNIFSEMRGISKVIVITKMSLQDDYQSYLSGVTEVYKKLRSIHKLTASPYMVLAAINIYEAGGLLKADENIEKLETVYKSMKADHFFLTSDSDRPFLAMMVSRDINIEEISNAVNECYNATKSFSFSKESMHTASQILALTNKSTQDKADELKTTMAALKKHGVRGRKYTLMPLVAALGLIDDTPDNKAKEIKELYSYLAKQRGFKWYLSPTKRSLYAGLSYAIGNISADNSLFNSIVGTTITNIIIEEIIIMIIILCSSNTTTNSSSTSN